MPDTRLEYQIVDVFTAQSFAGNPLAVVYGADDLTTEQLHALAVEFNLSETAFPMALTPEDVAAGAAYRVRIFTPGGEVPFAGHPTVGTAWALRQRGQIEAGRGLQSCGAGLITVVLPLDPAEAVELIASPRDAARRLTDDEVARLTPLAGLTDEDVVGGGHVAGCGLTWTYLQVSEEAISRARPGAQTLEDVGFDTSGLLDPCDGIDIFAVAEIPLADGALAISSRVFVPGFGIAEDPATGSAAAGLGLVLAAAGLTAEQGSTYYRIEQGVDMGRPSVLLGEVEVAAGEAALVHVAGQVVPVAEGAIAVPLR